MTFRSGIGYDVHRLVEGRPLVLGGITVLSDRGLQGHSDADVLTHAIMDALLGAAGLGDKAVDMDDWSVWLAQESAERVWGRYFEALAEAAQSGLFDILAHPDLVKVWGKDKPVPDGDLRRF